MLFFFFFTCIHIFHLENWKLNSFFAFNTRCRLFSCGTTKDGESHIVEWNENEGTVKRAYQGFHKHSSSIVQFDITRNRFLAAGDDYSIKVWDINNVNLLTTIDAEGDLPVSLFMYLSAN